MERHVLTVANRQVESGHRVWVASAGGRLVDKLSRRICHLEMPVDRKNIFTGLRCASKLAGLIRGENIQIIHAHSRVPAWIAYFARKRAPGAHFVFTAHALFSKNLGLWPIAQADGVLCVS
ncbi:glycosyltransferase, partial [Synergistaceae bacterium OttesenSCG-928-I11]|nr:glycosyltransferase [Synergistaceae bacterium OttesenSCG-928-I11]